MWWEAEFLHIYSTTVVTITLTEFTVLETRNTIVKMEEMGTGHIYLGFHLSY
jgi:hypothetical protein